MDSKRVESIIQATKSNTIKGIHYVSDIFKQDVSINANGDFEVTDRDYEVNLQLDIPVHTFESYINALVELRKKFNVVCAYSKEPITYENHPSTNHNIVADKSYTFTYWHSFQDHILFSNFKIFNVYMYLIEFDVYANLLVRSDVGGVNNPPLTF